MKKRIVASLLTIAALCSSLSIMPVHAAYHLETWTDMEYIETYGMLEFFARYLTIVVFGAGFGYTAICFADPATWTSTALVLLLPYYLWAHKASRAMKEAESKLA